mgnify:CR=1 FL=1|jgi:hypothetical protein|tara:strand:- start:603 stop:878 length:276 start_codon:yes stop_codon:yes gene_type:complete
MVDFIKEVEDDLYDVDARKLRNDEYTLNRQSEPKTPKQPINYPDAKKHQIVSFIKSGVRIAGYVLLAADMLVACAVVLILSEVIGIYEELV